MNWAKKIKRKPYLWESIYGGEASYRHIGRYTSQVPTTTPNLENKARASRIEASLRCSQIGGRQDETDLVVAALKSELGLRTRSEPFINFNRRRTLVCEPFS